MTSLQEDQVNSLADLFEACKLLKKYDLELRGVTCLEDAKCRLLKHIQECTGQGKPDHATVSLLYFARIFQKMYY